MAATEPSSEHDDDVDRRDFIYVAAGVASAVGAAFAAWPLINSMNPAADVQSLSQIYVDLSGVEPGQRITVNWQGRPVFIWRRPPQAIAEARATPLEDLVDPVDYVEENPNNAQEMPALDQNRTADEAGEWLVVIGICTHLGCVPQGQDGATVGNWGGWFCSCHGSHYDMSGRVRRGPAPRNLDIPPTMLSDTLLLRIG